MTSTDTSTPRLAGRVGLLRAEIFPEDWMAGLRLTANTIDERTGHVTGRTELRFDYIQSMWLAARLSRVIPPTNTGPWATIEQLVTWLDNTNGMSEHETAMRLLKLSEEIGEVGAAYIGATGQNPRKGTTHTPEDVADELCDVAITALVALFRFAANPERHFAAKLAQVEQRMNELCTCDQWRDDPCPTHADPRGETA